MLRPFGFMRANTGGGGGGATFADSFSYTADVETQSDWDNEASSGGKITASSGTAKFDTDGSGFQFLTYNGNSGALSADQYAKLKVVALPNSTADAIRLYARFTATGDYYGVYCGPSNTILYRVVSGTTTQLGATQAAVSPGDVVEIQVSGTTVKYVLNGSDLVAETDANHASGKVGFHLKDNESEVDDFECGDL